jgi:hypothetical protein
MIKTLALAAVAATLATTAMAQEPAHHPGEQAVAAYTVSNANAGATLVNYKSAPTLNGDLDFTPFHIGTAHRLRFILVISLISFKLLYSLRSNKKLLNFF